MSRHSVPIDPATQRCSATPPADPDDILRVLVHPARRAILQELVKADEPQSTDQLAIALVTESDETALIHETSRQQIEFTHNHLPRLRDVGLIKRTNDNLIQPTCYTHDALQLFDIVAGK